MSIAGLIHHLLTSTLLEYEKDAFPQQLAIIREKRKNICHPSGIQIPMDMVKVYVHTCCYKFTINLSMQHVRGKEWSVRSISGCNPCRRIHCEARHIQECSPSTCNSSKHVYTSTSLHVVLLLQEEGEHSWMWCASQCIHLHGLQPDTLLTLHSLPLTCCIDRLIVDL